MSPILRPLSTRAITRAVAVVLLSRLAFVGCAASTNPEAAAKPKREAAKTTAVIKEDPLLKAIALGDAGKLDASAKALEAILKEKDSAPARNALGVVRFRQGDRAAALKEFDAAIALDAKFTDAYFNRAGMRAAAGDTAGALADYEQVLKLKPDVKQQLAFAKSEKERLGGKK